MSNFYGSNLNEGNEISMVTSPFFTVRVQNTAFSLGYIIVTRRSKAKENGVVSYVTLICDRGGEYKFKESSSYLKQYDGWTLRVICHQHNHPPAQHMEGHAYARRLKENEKKLLVDLTSKNVTPRDILLTLKEQDKNNRAFLHVLIVDAMYKTNKYDLPFVQIVGVTSTNKTFSIAFAFIINEKENYNWALTCLKLTLAERMYPRVIVTDRELALMNACQQVFPDATWLLCGWHITENIKKHCRQSIKSQHEWDSFRAMWTVLVESPMWILYTENYRKLQSMLSEYLVLEDFLYITNIYINSGVLKYLDQVWLSKYKEMFVSVWIDRHLNFGERTTNRIVKSQLTSIYESFEKSRIVLKHRHNLPCFRLLRGFVALEALDILEWELQRSTRHQLDSSNCGCKLRHSCGLPCACMLSVYLNSGGECIPLDSINVFWRKLDLSPSTSVENEDICCDGELEMFKENFTKQSKARKKSLLRKLRDIFQPSKTLIKEPTIQKNTLPRRRSHSTMSKSVGLDLVELNKEPKIHSSYVTEVLDLNQEPSEQVSDFIDLNQMPESCYTHPLMKEIPDMFYPYITHVQDVRGDGNCGFRAISVCLDELLSSYDVYARVFTDGIDELRNSLCFSQSLAPAEH
ncbi:hypothetical protein CXB51_002927 [Gossypium anomalum]|uniref:OTU domain-containing protein n=1 Tax=Gossypium anomalum TaxID=47600 RepID=A0A8J5ZF39_9ROSI|nr:hypothetical protein CXB51_002927 [Gossypium anomalum]